MTEPATAETDEVTIVPYAERYAADVRRLFIAINRAMAPDILRGAFESYIERSVVEEIEQIEEYYSRAGGMFRLALQGNALRGMYGLEPHDASRIELRRMYVAADFQRRGLASLMLQDAEEQDYERGFRVLILSTSELQQAALGLYRSAGFTLIRVEIAETTSHKTIGGGIRRFHFEKPIG